MAVISPGYKCKSERKTRMEIQGGGWEGPQA